MRAFLQHKAGLAVALAAIPVLGAGWLSATPVSAAGPTVSLTSEEINLRVEGKIVLEGDSFNQPGLGSWTIDVYYNPDVVNIVDCGAELGGVCNPQFREDAARITGGTAQGRAGDFTLGSLSFTCKRAGETALELDIETLADATIGAPRPIEAKVVHGMLACVEGAQVKVPGDADCDGEVTALDASLILQFSAGLISTLPCPEQADVTGDGRVDPVDATIVLQMVAGLLT